MNKIYACTKKLILPLVNERHKRINDFVVEETTFWQYRGTSCDERIILETSNEEIQISKEQLKNHFNRI